ncbi:MAG: hypothetical protein GF347_04135 [Candidatus Moranbacteria bacterium]|nr:hypothetical protein [Candidatus Moranbacteria bacterium]
MSRYNQAVQKEFVASSLNEKDIAREVNFFEPFFYFLGNIFDFVASLIVIFILAYTFVLVVRLIFAAKKSGTKEANEIVEKEYRRISGLLGTIFRKGKNIFGDLFKFVWRKKHYALAVLILLFLWKVNVVELIKVSPGQKAVDIESQKILNPGIHLTSPLFSEYILAHVADYQFSIPEITAESKYPELQDVILNVNVTFHIKDEELIEFFRQQGPQMSIWNTSDQIVSPRVIEQIKKVVREYSFKEVHLNQEEIKQKSVEEIQKAIEPLGLELDELNIVNIRISQKFIDVFGETEILEEKRILETAELEQEKIRTEKEIEAAEREKQKRIIEAEGIAEANRIISSQNISPEMLELKRIENKAKQIEKWNGQAPQNVGGDFGL